MKMDHIYRLAMKIFILSLGLLLAASITTALAGDEPAGTLTITIKSGEFNTVQTAHGTKITMDDCGYRGVPGEPALPVRRLLVALPPGARATAVEVQPLSTIELPGTWSIAPAPPIRLLDGHQGLSPVAVSLQHEWQATREAAYSSNRRFPGTPARLSGTGTLRKYAYAEVLFHPFTWYSGTGRLALCDEARITVRYRLPAPGSAELRHTRELMADTAADGQAEKLFINFEEMAPLYSIDGERGIVLPDCDILIITDSGNVNGITNSNYMDWKRSLGFEVKIVLVSDPAITGQPGVDLAEQIRNYLRNNYGPLGIRYVLLVGDILTVPMRYCFPNQWNHTNNWPDPGNPGGAVPTDFYYADLSDDDDVSWDSDGDGYHGEYTDDYPDFLADVIVGRIPHNYNLWITYALDKMVAFEQDTGDWKRNALNLATIMFFANQDSSGYPVSDGGACMTIIEDQAMSGWNCTHLSEQAGLAPSHYPWPGISEAAVSDAWREGEYSVVNWACHGWVSGVSRTVWSSDDGDGVPESSGPDELDGVAFFLDDSNIDDDHPAIVYAVSCSVGYPEVTGLGNLGIHLLCKPEFGGSAGVISATRGAAVSGDWLTYGGGSESLTCEFNRLLHAGPADPNRVGDALYGSKHLVNSTQGWDHYYEYQNMYNFNLYGDPTLVHTGIDPTTETLGAQMNCTPAAGTAPFVTSMTVRIDNFYAEQTRRAAARIDVDLAGGTSYTNWRGGWTNILASSHFQAGWDQNIPALGSLSGDNRFTLTAVDVTPSPWNQPPYPPSGDAASASCTLTVELP
jgi:hypothetical protein